MDLTEIQNGKRVVSEFEDYHDDPYEYITLVLKECKMKTSEGHGHGHFSLWAKSGINYISVLTDMQHKYPHLYLALNNKIQTKWLYISDPSTGSEKLWICEDRASDGFLTLSEVLNAILNDVRNLWSNN